MMFLTVLGTISGCGGDQQKNKQQQATKDQDKSAAQTFLTYVDSLAQLPSIKFNAKGIQSLNHAFANRLPLVMYNSSKDGDAQNIVVQYYKNDQVKDTLNAGVILLVPKTLTDSLPVADFVRHFGPVKKEEPLIGVTAQPLPVQIDISAETSLKLTVNQNQEPDQAQVIAVEVLKKIIDKNEHAVKD